MAFKEELKKRAKEIEEELEIYVKTEDVPEKKLNDAVAYSLMAGGKRLRPMLMLEVYRIICKYKKRSNAFCCCDGDAT